MASQRQFGVVDSSCTPLSPSPRRSWKSSTTSVLAGVSRHYLLYSPTNKPMVRLPGKFGNFFVDKARRQKTGIAPVVSNLVAGCDELNALASKTRTLFFARKTRRPFIPIMCGPPRSRVVLIVACSVSIFQMSEIKPRTWYAFTLTTALPACTVHNTVCAFAREEERVASELRVVLGCV